jgi:hypothetical protein
MGHSDEMMTRRYQQRAAVLSDEQAEAIEAAMLGNGVGGRDNTASTKEQRRTA